MMNANKKYGSWLKAILENTLMGVIIFKSIRDKTGRIVDFEIVFVNKKVEESLNRKELTGKRLLSEFPNSTSTGLFNQYVKVTESGEAWEDEFYYNYEEF
ncbi:MAG: hypothetical protein ACOC10_10170, partial [Bacteroidota bacterium]